MRMMKDSGIEWIGEIPSSWDLNRLQWYVDEINVTNNPIQTKNVLSLTNKLGVIPYEEKGNQGNKSKDDYSEYKLAYENTIVANSMNILIGSVGISNYFGCVSPVYYVFKSRDNSDVRFINYIFQTVQFQKELRKYANGILEIRLRVSAKDILKRLIAIPDISTQKKIADYLDETCKKIDAMVRDINLQINILENYKKSVVTKAVTQGIDSSVELKDSGISWLKKYQSIGMYIE